ncbi:mycothiol transferase [Catenuloplanes japonicus]|uniref:mycothiol transferase n=1 Tax=Catenuloplanes japonicus TaxID=33876 RepID=UPI0038B8B615
MTRPSPPVQADERTTVRAMLDFHRSTLALKCAGLTDAQLRRPASPPSTLTLLGLVRHLAEVERTWFRDPCVSGGPHSARRRKGGAGTAMGRVVRGVRAASVWRRERWRGGGR